MAKGGYRPAGGRQKKSVQQVVPKGNGGFASPLEYMLAVMNDPAIEPTRRDRMAIAAAPFVHPRITEQPGKKDVKAEAAGKASVGKFAPDESPPIRAH